MAYILLAILYSVSFGVYSLRFIQQKFAESEEPQKRIEVTQKESVVEAPFYFHQSEIVKQAHEVSEVAVPQKSVFNPEQSLKKHILFSTFKLFSTHLGFSLFSRPPPAV